jgi:hypothetical protein
MQFEVANSETAYNSFLGRPGFTKFMVIPHYAFLVLNMPGPNGVISIKGDVKQAYDYDPESCETLDALLVPSTCRILRKLWSSPLWTP